MTGVTTRTCVVSAWLGLAAAGSAHAAWQVVPGLEARTEYDDNVRLQSDGGDYAIATSVAAEAAVASRTEVSNVSLRGGIEYVTYGSYDGPSNLDDRDNEFLRLAANRQMYRSDIGINARLKRDDLFRSTRISEDDPGLPVDPGDGAGVDDGLDDVDSDTVSQEIRRTSIAVAPYYSIDLNERTALRMSYRYGQSNYDEEIADTARDSTTNGVGATLERQMSEVSHANIAVQASRFNPEDATDTDIYQVTAGWKQNLSERLRIELRLGGRRTEESGETDTGFVYGLNAAMRFEQGVASVSLEQSALPNSFGEVVETDLASARYQHQFTQRLSFDFVAAASRTRSIDELVNDRDRDFVSVRSGVSWALTPEISVGAEYRYRWIDRQTTDSTAESHAGAIILSYQPRKPF